MSIIDHNTVTMQRLARAAACLRQAVSLIEEVVPGIAEILASDRSATPSGNSSAGPSITDRATFSVHWADRTCRLGDTMPFRLLERLARRPNRFIHCDVLLEELWDEHTSSEAVRSTVKILRRKLTAAGMEDLAEAIDGSTARHYALMLAGAK
ncbi:MAG: helix-turn-helix domain-containing protein [Thermoguttaceae bacterium]